MPTKSNSKKTKKNTDRKATVKRKTKETDISIELNLDGVGDSEIDTRIEFLNHLFELFSRHSSTDLKIKASGDLDHHITEDIGICLGEAIMKSLGNKKGIRRYGDKTIPMDESLATCALDLGGRPYFNIDLKISKGLIEDSQAEDLEHLFESISINSKINLHIIVHYGTNEHHKVEAAIKAFARAFKEAKEIVDDKIPSTKGVL
ncbi:MAG: imidazoleglycerol-phosphate dehydratase HisB [Candidatus Lokiarchaeota archaeon]|nr:imidazoleglycerol-phosphate dehydratase HisB [Candidatus Lokiarchaeota archaeon]